MARQFQGKLKRLKIKIALRPRVVCSHLKPSPSDQKAINFTKSDLKIEVDAKDSCQETEYHLLMGQVIKPLFTPCNLFVAVQTLFFMGGWVKLT